MQNKQGGKRAGAGRKPAPYKTVTVSFRIRDEESLIEKIKLIVANEVIDYNRKNPV